MIARVGIIASRRFDPDALAFMAAGAANITDATLRRKVNAFTLGLKANGLWNDIVSCHPYVGGNATAHAYNLRNISTYFLTFIGAPTHNSNGMVLDGASQYARTANGEYYLSEILGTDKYTMMARVNLTAQPNATNGAGSIHVSIGGDANAGLFEMTLVNNTTNFRVSHRNYTTSAQFNFPTSPTFNLNEFANVGATYNGSILKNYKDDTPSATTVSRTGNIATTVFDNNFRYVAHGARPASLRSGTNSFLTGTFSFALVAKRAFSDSEMATLHNLIVALKS